MHSASHVGVGLLAGLVAIAIGLNYKRFRRFRDAMANAATKLYYWPVAPLPRARFRRSGSDFNWADWIAGQTLVAMGVLLIAVSAGALVG